MTGYNSYSSYLISIEDIYNSEMEKGNHHVCEAIDEKAPNHCGNATWVCMNPITCFKQYVLSAEDFDIDDEEVIRRYPDYMHEVYEVNLNGLTMIVEDGCGGFLYADLRQVII